MRKKVQTVLIFFLILTTGLVLGKSNKTKTYKVNNNKKQNIAKEKPISDRIKRSLSDDDDQQFWANRGKKQIDDEPNNYYDIQYDNGLLKSQKITKSSDQMQHEQPFWGNRGRRENSLENMFGFSLDYPDYYVKHCEHCQELPQLGDAYRDIKDRRTDFASPFWGNRGRRNSDEIQGLEDDPFWGNRGRRQEQEPFWGNRGRRTENEPFWGNRGRREKEPFWGNRGRREEDPFWGNRGRREEEPFWGNRGRRETDDPFWGNRGRREEPFWGNRGRRKNLGSNWHRNRKEDLKESILNAINDVENDIEYLSRLKKSNTNPSSFWASRGRDNRLSELFNAPSRSKILSPKVARSQPSEPGTVLDNRMYVEEPKYILVERSGRSSAEMDDPYYISRGKKYYLNYSLAEAARDRRGALEEIVKSVRNDPYYIARGKKDTDIVKNKTTTARKEEYSKAKELICAAIDLMNITNKTGKVKRDIDDNDRDRRTILKKLAAQLQMDPYFVSRGKKNQVSSDKYHLQEFISNVAEKCN